MIELRWVIAPRKKFDHTEGREYTAHERVLQYRYYKMHEISGDTYMHKLADWAMGWTEWMDVPDAGVLPQHGGDSK